MSPRLAPLLLLLFAAARTQAGDDCRKSFTQLARPDSVRAEEYILGYELARLGVRLRGIMGANAQGRPPLQPADYGRGVSNLLLALVSLEDVRGVRGVRDVRGVSEGNWLDAVVAIYNGRGVETFDFRRGVSLLIPHDAPEDALARDVPTKILEWRLKKTLPRLERGISRLSAVDPDAYLNGLEAFLEALEEGRVDDDLLRNIDGIRVTNGGGVHGIVPYSGWRDGAVVKTVLLEVPVGDLGKPALLKTAAMEAWAERMLGRIDGTGTIWRSGMGWSWTLQGVVEGGESVDRADYDNALERLVGDLSAALTSDTTPSYSDMGRLGRVRFGPPGAEARAELVRGPVGGPLGGRVLYDVHVPVDAEAPLDVIVETLAQNAGW